MSTHRRVFQGGLTLGFNQGFSQACSFIRNVIVARILSPADYGIAALFAMTFSLLDMVSNLSADKLLIQAADGDEAKFQKTAHTLHAVRGALNAAVLLAIAGPVSRLFGVPQALWAFRLLALLPLLRGFTHLDPARVQREMKFWPQVLCDSGSSLLLALLALPLGIWLRDYALMLWLLVIQAAAYVVFSHVLAERPYTWGWNAAYARRIASFGWPLLINGLLMYIIFQGDHFIIGTSRNLFARNHYTLADLGTYSVAFALTMAPAMLVSNVSSSLFLPLLARAQGAASQFRRRYVACAELVAAVATAFSIAFIMAGGPAVVLVYGRKYAGAGAFIAWLGAMWTLRTLRQAPTLAAMAYGDTRNSMVSNIARTLALGGVLFVAATGQALLWIPVCGFAGEVLALAVCVWRLQREHGVSAKLLLKPFSVCAAGMGAAALTVWAGIGEGNPLISLIAATVLLVAMAGVTFAVSPELRTGVTKLFRGSHPPATTAEAVWSAD